jgi:hypothetical protein
MTTERRLSGRRLAAGLCVGFLGWVGAMALAALVTEPGSLLALGPAPAILAADDGAVAGVGAFHVLVRPIRPGAAARLYGGGAWLVLPAPGIGCLDGKP